jgi:hydroxyquinol 1,2-dioxygenase
MASFVDAARRQDVVNIDEWTITKAVLEVQAGCKDARLQEVMTSLVRHLHDFAREVQLTEAEWTAGIEFLTQAGHISDDKRQEFILLSDTLGLSTLVTAQNNAKPAGCTESTVFGPFFVEGAPKYANGDDISNGAKGQPCYVSGRVRSVGGEAIAGAQISVWQSDEDGFYDVQRAELEGAQARGELVSGPNGRYYFKTILAAPYPIPHDGPVGRMLQQLGRHPWRPAHLHFMVKAPGFQDLITHIFRAGDPYLESDAVFGVRSSLVTHWARHEPGTAPDGSQLAVPFYTVEYDIVLNPVPAG